MSRWTNSSHDPSLHRRGAQGSLYWLNACPSTIWHSGQQKLLQTIHDKAVSLASSKSRYSWVSANWVRGLQPKLLPCRCAWQASKHVSLNSEVQQQWITYCKRLASRRLVDSSICLKVIKGALFRMFCFCFICYTECLCMPCFALAQSHEHCYRPAGDGPFQLLSASHMNTHEQQHFWCVVHSKCYTQETVDCYCMHLSRTWCRQACIRNNSYNSKCHWSWISRCISTAVENSAEEERKSQGSLLRGVLR